MKVFQNICGWYLVHRDDGTYGYTADDNRAIERCPNCGEVLVNGGTSEADDDREQ